MSCKKLIKPSELIEKYPNDIKDFILQSRKTIKDIIFKKNKRFLVIVGPCSIHDIDQWFDYAKQLKEISRKYKNLFIVMRTYFEKPRTTIWWKWLIQDPDLNNSWDINKWLELARKFLLEVNKLGLPAATEFLEPFTRAYFQDLISYGAIWARTTESQVHRELASDLDFPVWFKNSTDGNIDNACAWVLAAKFSHSFIFLDENWQACIKKSNWNPYGHIILRWWKNGPNYDERSVQQALETQEKYDITTWLIIDASHANSWKKANNQIKVIQNVLEQKKAWNSSIVWVMIESNINFWNQSFIPGKDNKAKLKYGISITDECIDIKQTDEILSLLNNI